MERREQIVKTGWRRQTQGLKGKEADRRLKRKHVRTRGTAVEMDRISRRLELCSSSCRLEMEDHENEGAKMALRTEREG